MIIDDKTAHFNLPLPHIDNAGTDDVGRIRQAVNGLDSALYGHNHDATYSLLTHNHNATYAAIGHNHATSYAALTHNHDAVYATPSYVTTAINNIVGAMPGALSTLSSFSAALGNDPNFALTITNQLAAKANISHSHVVGDFSGIGSGAFKDAPVSGNATAGQLVLGNDTRLSGSLIAANNLSEFSASPAVARGNLGIGAIGTKAALLATDIPALDWAKISTGKPTTMAGYGLADAAPLSHVNDAAVHLTAAQNTWIDAITASAAEVNALSGATAGSVTSGKAVLRDVNGYTYHNYCNIAANDVGLQAASHIMMQTGDNYTRWQTSYNFFASQAVPARIASDRYRWNIHNALANSGVMSIGKSYAFYYPTYFSPVVTWYLPTPANCTYGDTIEVISMNWTNDGGWSAAWLLAIACPSVFVRIGRLPIGESLVIDTPNIQKLTFTCTWNDGTIAHWAFS